MTKIAGLLVVMSGLLTAQPPPDALQWVYYLGANPFLDTLVMLQLTTNGSHDTRLIGLVLGTLENPDMVTRHSSTAQATSVTPVTTGSLDTTLDAVYPLIPPFYEYFPGGLTAVQTNPSTVQPAAPPDPRMIFVDGYGSGLIAVDMTTLSVASQVAAVPQSAGPVAVRPSSSGSSNEVWVADNGTVAVADLAGQAVVATIPIPSLPVPVPLSITPTGIVFTPDGATAFEAFRYGGPDSSGNSGLFVVFNAATRTITGTLPLKNGPTALLMAPDGSTAYLLSANGMLTYYDVLSGAADLSVSTVRSGSNTQYEGVTSSIAIHPDGTRLFWNVGTDLVTFDLTTRTVTNQFNSGLPTTAQQIFSMSQDGALAVFSGQLGDVSILSTDDGTILATFSTGEPTSMFTGPPIAP